MRVWDGTRTCARRQTGIVRTRPTERTGSTGIEALQSKPSQSLLSLSLSHRGEESRERVHERTHTQAGTRAESRSQSPAVGGRFDVAAAAATFTTLNTFISRSDILPLPSPRVLPPRTIPPSLAPSPTLQLHHALDFVPQFISVSSRTELHPLSRQLSVTTRLACLLTRSIPLFFLLFDSRTKLDSLSISWKRLLYFSMDGWFKAK